jgi:hypothetical protein
MKQVRLQVFGHLTNKPPMPNKVCGLRLVTQNLLYSAILLLLVAALAAEIAIQRQ